MTDNIRSVFFNQIRQDTKHELIKERTFSMYFEPSGIYHIYNQGNNRQLIFFNRENYLYFTRKIREQILPFGNILAWCLMPNHFHLMVEVDKVTISRDATSSRTPTNTPPTLSLNHSIGILLASYTRAINGSQQSSGSLFRQKTKAICLNEIKGVTSNWFTSFGVTFLNVQIPEYQYLKVCFDYIHLNPVKSGLVGKPGDWEFSSFADLHGMRNGSLVNHKRVKELGLIE